MAYRSDRPTKKGGPFTFVATMVLASLASGAIAVLAVRYFFAQKLGTAGYFLLVPGISYLDAGIFAFGAVTGLIASWKAWREATAP